MKKTRFVRRIDDFGKRLVIYIIDIIRHIEHKKRSKFSPRCCFYMLKNVSVVV